MYESIKNMSDVELYDKLSLDKKNSRLAFDELYNRHSQRIFTYCRKYISNQSAAEDIFQDVFTKLYTSSQRGDKIQNVVGFLMTVARNLCYNEVHRKRAVTTGHDNLDMPYYDNTFENVDLKNIIDMAIETLPDKLKELI